MAFVAAALLAACGTGGDAWDAGQNRDADVVVDAADASAIDSRRDGGATVDAPLITDSSDDGAAVIVDIVETTDTAPAQDAQSFDANHGPCGSMWWCAADGGAACVDLASDTMNCGACGNACALNETCSNGMCLCPTGTTYCDSWGTQPAGCYDLQRTSSRCGACFVDCTAGGMDFSRVCYDGLCIVTCGYGRPACPSGQFCCASAGGCVPDTATCM